MATIAEVRIPSAQFALHHTLTTLEDTRFEIERIVAHEAEHVMPYVWATGVDPDDLERVLGDDPSVEVAETLARPGDSVLYQMKWIASIEALIHILVDEEGTVLAAEGTPEGWFLRVLFPAREALSATYDFCREHDLEIDVQRIYNVDDGKQGRFGLTESQETTLTEAYNHGYYAVPREVSLSELAETLDVSHQALSERLRRSHRALIENAVIIGEGIDGDDG
ncbi:helix-turn-helix domain-containing protein [Halalkalicoccus ordinarius]|uniref:helix-turn-helix domain-containing protein n=1 Tax=Halalkalicoccus ordinarius TaxID=3116651 RepID=UPI00300F4A7E